MKTLRLLVPPGIGDIHWVALKLRAFLEKENAVADVWILDHDRRPRGLSFVRRLPFVRAAGYYRPSVSEVEMLGEPRFKSCYFTGEHDLLPDFLGFDFLLCFNGSLRTGKKFEEILPTCRLEWDYPVTEEKKDTAILERVPKKYVLFGLSDFTIFSEWVKAIGEEKLRALLAEIPKRFPGRVPVLTGASWDAPLNRRLSDMAVDLTGQTSLGELLALIRRADAFVGFAGGNGIVATHLGCPTHLIWHHGVYPEARFRQNWVDGTKNGGLYTFSEAASYTQEGTLSLLAHSMIHGGKL